MPIAYPYRDPATPLEDRVADLLKRMTLAEKLAQLGSVWAFDIVSGGRADRERMARLLGNGLGEITRLAGATNLSAVDVARTANDIQRYLVEETRLGVPAIIHEETLHGLLASDAPCFQQSIGAAASWDPEIVEAVATTIRRRMLATGARHALAPVLDVTRDPRWGRIEETYGEDPYLVATMGVSYTRGLQGSTPAEGVIATGKVLVGHGLPEAGLNAAPVHAGWRELRDEQLFPFEAAIREGDLGSVMPAYSEVDGIPCHASRELLRTILRGEWQFDGIVVSDHLGIEMIVQKHQLTDDMATAACLALEAGVDIELPRASAYAEPLARAIAEGRVGARLVDETVARVLRAKFRLGLFEVPYVDPPTAAMLSALADEEERLGRELARRSFVLLENDGILPLSSEHGRIAIIGPIAASKRDLLGDYSHVAHVEALLEFGLTQEVSLGDVPAGRRTVLDVIRARIGSDAVLYARGSGLREGADSDIREAVEVARAADVAILFLGERSGLTDDATTGEGRDRRDLGFLGRQQELLEAVVATGTPVVLVVVSGRPLAIEWAARHCSAVLLAWVPGDEGPNALADVLLGDENPGGKLPVSVPRHVGQVPLSYRHHPSGGRSNSKGDYVDGPGDPLWPFGFGRSYTSFALSDLTVSDEMISTDGGQVTITVGITNTGARSGDEVVQLYVRDEEARVVRPFLELCGFKRVHLDPGQQAVITYTVAAEQFSYTSVDYRRIIEPGTIRLSVGTSSADRPLTATIGLVGPVVDLPARSRFLTSASVRVRARSVVSLARPDT